MTYGQCLWQFNSETVIMAEQELVDVKRQRAGLRGWLKRAIVRLNSLQERDDVSKENIQIEIEEVICRKSELSKIQGKVELLIETEEDLIADIETADSYVTESNSAIARAQRRLDELREADSQRARENEAKRDGDLSSFSSPLRPFQGENVNLPRIEIAKFSGEYSEWNTFFDTFSALVDSTNMANITKFTYLQSYLTGDAKKAIEGLTLSSVNYQVALEILKERYGRKEIIIFGHVQNLLGIDFQTARDVKGLWKVFNELQINIRCLDSLEVSGEQYGLILTPMIVSRLTQDLRTMWARKSSGKEGDLAFLMEFLKQELENRDRSLCFGKGTNDNKCSPTNEPKSQFRYSSKHRHATRSTATAFPAVAMTGETKEERNVRVRANVRVSECEFCGGLHGTERCKQVREMDLDEVRNKIKMNKMCFVCFRKGHFASRCYSHCKLCGRKHNELFCRQREKTSGYMPSHNNETNVKGSMREGDASNVSFCQSGVIGKTTVLQTTKLRVNGEPVTVMFDSGSDRSFITKKAVLKTKPSFHCREELSVTTFESNKPSNVKQRNIFSVPFMKEKGGKEQLLLTEVDNISSVMFRPAIPCEILSNFDKCYFAEELQDSDEVEIDILIGQDYLCKLLKFDNCIGCSGLVAQQTVMGPWILSGFYSNQTGTEDMVKSKRSSHQFLCLTDFPQNSFRKLWDLEYLECPHEKEGQIKSKVLQEFSENTTFEEKRYKVALPWKSEEMRQKLENNIVTAQSRCEKLERKLRDNTNRYKEVFETLEKEGVVHEVPDSELEPKDRPVYYLPHFPVYKENSVSTKVRPVFDASSRGPNGVSLNDCLHVGPNLLPSLTDILMRFRRWPVALTADVQKAFLQIKLKEEDQDVQRFLLKEGERIRVMRCERVIFGCSSSPFLLIATIKLHLSKYERSSIIQEMEDNIYMDDLLTGADDVNQACKIQQKATEIMSEASMKLCKWNSNSDVVKESLQKKFSDEIMPQSNEMKILGLRWDPISDGFGFSGYPVSCDVIVTKRVVLSLLARIFDPLGFLGPFVVSIKIMFQEVWKLGLNWDQEVPGDIKKRFQKWIADLESLKELTIPRCYVSVSWLKSKSFELHCFSDSSLKAYGAVVYLKTVEVDGTVSVALVLSKVRVSPLKPVTLPRLELLGAVVGARLVHSVKGALRYPDDVSLQYFCWTDSSVALRWIKSDPTQWKMFVCNRVAQIQELTEPEAWSHCPGKENPADCITRGLTAEQLLTNPLWFQGPTWLKEPLCNVGRQAETVIEKIEENSARAEEEKRKTEANVCVSSSTAREVVLETERWGGFSKTLRVVGWVMRFINNARKKKRTYESHLTGDELQEAKRKLLISVQCLHFGDELNCLLHQKPVKKSSVLSKMNPYLDEQGLIRMKGRLMFSNLSLGEKSPIILPKCQLVYQLIQREHLRLKHAGVSQVMSSLRNEYWIIGLRSLVKKMKRECIRCQRFDSKECTQSMAPLPVDRLKQASPFNVVGIDFAGPLFTADAPGRKFYVLLFTCCVIRAVHVELCESLSLKEFLLAFRRFTARRGMPFKVLSDNAKTFVAASKHLVEVLTEEAPKWRFNVPRAPWRGGIWERLVRSVKSSLKKSIGTGSLTRRELETGLIEIESCINNRPLTFVSDDPECHEALTPSHFLIGRADSHRSVTEGTGPILSGAAAREANLYIQERLDIFWDIWQKEYIRGLPLVRSSPKNCPVKLGSLVLLKEDCCPRLHWPLARVVQLIPGKDGIVRTLEVRTAKSTFVRPIQRVHVLELEGVISDDVIDDPLITENSSDLGSDGNVSVKQKNISRGDKAGSCVSSRSDSPNITSRGRVVKKVTRLDL